MKRKQSIVVAIEDRVDAILALMQRDENIIAGDVDIETEMRLVNAIDALADAMIRVLDEQKQHNKGDDKNE